MINAFGMYEVGFNGPAPGSESSSDGSGAALHGDGPPGAGLGDVGNTYVDDLTNGLYWKSASGWNP